MVSLILLRSTEEALTKSICISWITEKILNGTGIMVLKKKKIVWDVAEVSSTVLCCSGVEQTPERITLRWKKTTGYGWMQKLLACSKKSRGGGEVGKERGWERGRGECAVHLAEQQEGKLETGFFSFWCLAVVCRHTSGVCMVLCKMWTKGESEGLQTLGIVVVVCSSLKLLHYLGLIDLSDGKRTPVLQLLFACV